MIQSPGTNIKVSDTHVGEADATASGGAGGALGAAVLTASGTDSPTVNAYLDSGATVGNGHRQARLAERDSPTARPRARA